MQTRQNSGATVRAIIIGLLLTVITCYWVMISFIWGSGESGTITLIYNVVFTLFIIILINFFLLRFLPRFSFSQGELLTIYIMVNTACVLASHFTIQVLVPIIPHAFWFATPENEWKELFWRYIPRWLSVDDKGVLADYYKGESTLYTIRHIKGWLEPVLWWSAFLFALLFVMLCINVIVRKQWTEREKLGYPLIQLPVEMTDETWSFFRQRLMWIAFAVATLINLLNGLHFLWPTVPNIISGEQYDISRFFPEKPLSAIGWTPVCIYPFAIGVAFFMPLDLSFSCWFFYFFWKFEKILGSVMGIQSLPLFPYSDEQSFGAYIGLGILALWVTRKHIYLVVKKIINSRAEIDDSNEPMSYRAAVLLMVTFMSFLVLFCFFAGMSLWVILLFFLLFLLLSISFTRIRAVSGVLFHDLHFMGPDSALVKMFGAQTFGASNLTMFSFLYFFNRAHTSNPMPHQLEGFKIAERTGIRNRGLLSAILLSIVVGALASFWALLHGRYKFGSGGSFGWGPFMRLQRWLVSPTRFSGISTVFTFGGMMFVFLLSIMRQKFIWWSLHPIGYAISGTYTMNIFWLSFMISWAIKWMILKQGGLRIYRRATPFFFGLILGEFIMGSLWSILAIVFQTPMYSFIN